MSQFQLYLTGVTISVVFSIFVVAYIRKPLHHVLVDLCGTDGRARFWAQITHLSFVLIAMLMAFTYRPHYPQADYYYLTGHLGRTLLGLLGVTAFLALTISRFIRRNDRSDRLEKNARQLSVQNEPAR